MMIFFLCSIFVVLSINFFPICVSNSSLAERELGWKADRSIEQMCSDFWRWQKMNPVGYKTVLTNGHSH